MAELTRQEIIKLIATNSGDICLQGVNLSGLDLSYLNLSRINFAYVNLSPDRSQNAPLLLSGKRAACARFSPVGCAQN